MGVILPATLNVETVRQALRRRPERIATRARFNPITGTVGIAATQVLNADPNRLLWTAVNLSANDGFIGWQSGVSSSNGILIAANGGSITTLYREDADLVGISVWAINNVAPGTWFFVDVIAEDLLAWLDMIGAF